MTRTNGNPNKWGKWYQTEDGKKLVCLVKNYPEYEIELEQYKSAQQRDEELSKLAVQSGGQSKNGVKRIDRDVKGLKMAFYDIFEKEGVAI